MTPLDDDMLAVAAPFVERGRGLKKPLRCAEALYEHFIQHGNPLNGLDLDLFGGEDDDDGYFPSAPRTARSTRSRRNGLRRASCRSRMPMPCS